MATTRRGRKSRTQARLQETVQRRLPRTFQVATLNDDDIGQIHDAVKLILWEIGVAVADRDIRDNLIATHKCRDAGDGQLQFPPELVERALSSVPGNMTLYDRNGNLAVDTDDGIPRFSPGVNCVNVLDHTTGTHRSCGLQDIRNAGRVCEALQNIDVAMSLGYPADVDPEIEALESARALTETTRKPIGFTGHDEVKVEAIWSHLAEIAGGWDALAEKPCGLDLTGPLSPLRIGEETCRRLKFAAERYLPVVCYPALFPGMSGPITLAGSIAQSSAEALAGVVIHQTARPGAPIMSGTAILPMDMRQADLAYGSPEYALAGLGASEYFNAVGLPNWVAAGCSDSHEPDQQAAAEAGMNMALAALAGTSFIHNLGYLSAGRTGSLEMLVMCDELAGMVSKMARGIEVNRDTLAIDVIRRAAPDNSFVSDKHTFDRYLDEMWMPGLFRRSNLEAWQGGDQTSFRESLKSRVSEILS